VSSTSWKELPGPARAIGTALGQAVDAARERDADAYEAAAVELVALPGEQTGRILGDLIRLLLEELYPDGVDSDDIRTVLHRCYRSVGFLPVDSVEVPVLIAALASALGIHEPGVTYEEPAAPDLGAPDLGAPEGEDEVIRVPTGAEYVRQAPLLVADLLAVSGRPLGRCLDRVLGEIARAESMEMP
jgi:hypothetical protein